jgi:hypothetical protein
MDLEDYIAKGFPAKVTESKIRGQVFQDPRKRKRDLRHVKRRNLVSSFVKEDFFQACNQEPLELLTSSISGTQGSPGKRKGTRPFRVYLAQWGRTRMT